MTTNPVTSQTYVAPANDRVQAKALGQQDFLKLLIAQLGNQNPTKPTDSDSMMTQMTQIASIQAMTAMQQGMTRLGVDQQLTLGQQLINKRIQLHDSDANVIVGNVTKVTASPMKDSNGNPTTLIELEVNGKMYPLSGLESVLPDVPATPSTTPATP